MKFWVSVHQKTPFRSAPNAITLASVSYHKFNIIPITAIEGKSRISAISIRDGGRSTSTCP
jgi:hypothetical protein